MNFYAKASLGLIFGGLLAQGKARSVAKSLRDEYAVSVGFSGEWQYVGLLLLLCCSNVVH